MTAEWRPLAASSPHRQAGVTETRRGGGSGAPGIPHPIARRPRASQSILFVRRGLQVARDRAEFRGGPGAVVRDHPRGFPRPGEHHVGGCRDSEPTPRARFVPAQTGGGDGDPPGRGVRCPGHPPPHREATARIAKHPVCSPAGVSPGGGHGAGCRPARPSAWRPVSPGATGSARPRRVPRWPRRCSARPSARFSTPRRASRRWWTRRVRSARRPSPPGRCVR